MVQSRDRYRLVIELRRLRVGSRQVGITTDRGAPTIDRRPSGYDAHLTWRASPGAAGYRIFWRDAWAPDWQQELFVGNVTEYTLPHINVDDWVFGVAAVDSEGHESTVSMYVPLPAAY